MLLESSFSKTCIKYERNFTNTDLGTEPSGPEKLYNGSPLVEQPIRVPFEAPLFIADDWTSKRVAEIRIVKIEHDTMYLKVKTNEYSQTKANGK